MNNDATVIVGKLDDKALRDSIDSLVETVNKKTQQMAKDFNESIKEMQVSLKNLGKSDLNSTGTSDGGSSKRVKAQNAETQSVEATEKAYDKLLGTLQYTRREVGAISQKKFVSSEELDRYEQGLKRMVELEAKLNETQGQLALARAKSWQTSPNMKEYTDGLVRTSDELKKLHDYYKNGESLFARQTAAAKEYTQEVINQANIIRETMKRQQSDTAFYGKYVIYDPSVQSQNLSIEEQIARAMKEEQEAAQKTTATRKEEEGVILNVVKSKKEAAKEEAFAFEKSEKAQKRAIDFEKEREEADKRLSAAAKKRYEENEREIEILRNKASALSAVFQSKSVFSLDLNKIVKEIDELYAKLRKLREEQNMLSSGDYAPLRSSLLSTQGKQVDELRSAIASLLNVSESEIKTVNTKTASYNQLIAYLKQLQTAYNNVGGDLARSGSGAATAIADEIQKVQRAIQQIQRSQSRPTDLRTVLGLDEKTIDNITYKMQQLSAYRSNIDITDPSKALEIQQVNKAYSELQKKQQEILGQNKSMLESNNALTRSFNYMKNRLAFYFTVGAASSFVKSLVEIRSQYEMTEKALGILVDSAERGSQIFQELSDMALVSPYTLIELSAAAKQLTAYDVAAKDVVDTTRRLADMAAAVGIPIERLTYALGQIKSYGYLNARDARMFANAGIPLVRELSKQYTELEGRLVSTADIYDRIKKKAISYEDVMSTVNRMTDEGGKFFDFQAKMAETLKVQLANLTLAWNNMLNDIGEQSQGLLSGAIGLLKNLFLHWKDLDRVIYDAVITFGIMRGSMLAINTLFGKGTLEIIKNVSAMKNLNAAQKTFNYEASLGNRQLTREQAVLIAALYRKNMALRQALVNMKLLTAEELKNISVTKVMGAIWSMFIKGLWTGVKAIGSALLSLAPMMAVFAVADLIQYINNLGKVDKAIQEGISNSAKEAANSLHEMNEAIEKSGVISRAKTGEASADELQKTWNALREEIEKSSDASAIFISELIEEEDLAKRVTMAFDVTKNIEEANLKMQDMINGIKISEDSWLHGAFGEGLVSDIEDLADTFEKYKEKGWSQNIGAFSDEVEEADKEMRKLAVNIKKTLNASNITDPTEVREALGRIRSEIKKETKLGGIYGNMFDIEFDKIMSESFDGVFDVTTTLWKRVLDAIKRDSSNTFTTLTDDILKENEKWSDSQLNAIIKGFEKVKGQVPAEWGSVLDKMQSMLNEREFKVRILAEFNLERSDFQKEFEKRAKSNMLIDYDKYYKPLAPDANDNLLSWAGKLQDEIHKLNEENKALAKDSTEYSKIQMLANDKLIQQRKDALDLFHQPYEKDKSTSSQKDVLGEALQKEVEIVTNMQKKFNEYRSAGVSAQEAVTKATDEYGSTLKATNATLAKYGIATKNGKELSQMRLRDIRDYFVSLREEAVKLGNTKGIEALEKGIANLNTEITKLDYKRITEGLNNELAKLKDEYELSVELGADPELGDMFTSLFDIDPNQLPKTIDEYAERVLQRLNAYFRDTNAKIQLPTLDLTDEQLDSYRKMLYDNIITQDAFNAIESNAKTLREMRYKEVRDLHSQIRDLQYELADQYGKIKIEEKELAVLIKRYDKENDERKKKLLGLQIEKQQQVITELKSGILQLMPTYKKLFGDVSEYSAATTRRLANNLKRAYLDAQKNVVGTQKKGDKLVALYQYIDPESGETVIMTMKELGQAIEKVDKEASKSKSTFEKLKDAFDGNSEGVKDFAKGIELIGEELNKVADGVRLAGNIAQALGADEETVGVINDIGQALDGLGQVAQGIGQMATDPIGGVVNVIGGMFSAIGSIFNGYNRRINREIEKSEKAVDQLSLAYQRLEFAVEKSMGSAETSWRRAAIANKKMQLEELQRQLVLEQSRKQKDQDEEKQTQLRSQIISLQQEIDNLSEEVVSTLTGSDIKSAAEEFVDTWVQAWKAGETTLDAIEEKMDSVIENIIKKAMTNKIVGALLDPLYNEVDRMTRVGSEGGEALTTAELRQLAEKAGITAKDIDVALGEFYGNLESLGIVAKTQEESKQLSALQQGLQSMSETTANALEAYANSISQQVYLHSTLLTEIRDILLGGDSDMSMGVQAQMLLELQQSHQVQAAIHAMLQGWSNANGMAVRVELV